MAGGGSSAGRGSQRWTTRSDVVQTLRKRWGRGDYLTALAQGGTVVPLSVPLRSPGARELADRFGEVQDWVRRWEADPAPLRLEYGTVGGRLIGANRVPVRVWADDEAALWHLLGVRPEVEAFTRLLERTRADDPRLEPWVHRHPLAALAAADSWDRLLAVVRWVVEHGGPTVYLRQIDVAGVDTKFVETHRRVLAGLLDTVLPADRIDAAASRGAFAERYRLAVKPAYMRCRSLDGRPLLEPADGRPPPEPADGRPLPAPVPGATGPTEITLRVDELAGLPLPGRTVIVVENEITFLALPAVTDALAVLGGGYAVPRLEPVAWLRDRDVHYWGDLDTHGFVILDRLRAFLPAARSLLMDRETLEGHRDHWGREPTPVNARTEHLTGPELAVYRDLVEDRYAPALRLEQERLRFGRVRATLEALGGPGG